MREWKQGVLARAAFTACVAGLSLALQFSPARAQGNNTYEMKIALPTLNDTIHQVAKNYAASTLAGVSQNVSKSNTTQHQAYEIVIAAASRTAPGTGE